LDSIKPDDPHQLKIKSSGDQQQQQQQQQNESMKYTSR